MSSLASVLQRVAGKDVYLGLKQEYPDFTTNRPVHLYAATDEVKFEFPLPIDVGGLRDVSGVLMHYLCPPDAVKPNLVLGWNIKNFFSYMLAKTKAPFVFEGPVFDLRVLEHYCGIEQKQPTSFAEAKGRLGKVVKNQSWGQLKSIYSGIYSPLVNRIIPEIETTGIINQKTKKKVYAYYEITGQANGRMKCAKVFNDCYNPHSMGEDDKEILRPPGFDQLFMYLDFKHMEVTVLQWLSGDPVLGEILSSGKDLYEQIWYTLTSLEGSDYRKLCKSVFLPVIFGLGPTALAEKLKCNENTARSLWRAIYKKFPVATGWIEAQQKSMVNGICRDKLDRAREFVDQQYRARNFVVQSPSALFCLDRLVALHNALNGIGRIGFHVHDGYGLFVNKLDIRRARDVAIKALQAESDLFPGLRLKVSCSTGESLVALKQEDNAGDLPHVSS